MSFSFLKRLFSIFLSTTFLVTSILSPCFAQGLSDLPLPGTMLGTSSVYMPVVLRGMTVYPKDPFHLDFIVDNGDSGLQDGALQQESRRLVNYFLAAMTVPSDDLWVNLSPTENDRIIPDSLGKTELGQDLLSQDYMLKQLAASMMYPDSGLGKKFWDRVYAQVYEKYGTLHIPTDTFNKVWIMPERARIHEQGAAVYVVDAKLKVMLDADRAASAAGSASPSPSSSEILVRSVLREIIIPEIEKEINTGRNFAPLRQIYYALILSKWYKQKVKDSILSRDYIDQNKVQGVDLADPEGREKIYQRYMEAYRQGVYNYIKEELDESSRQTVERKYVSGGFQDAGIVFEKADPAQMLPVRAGTHFLLQLQVQQISPTKDSSMLTELMPTKWHVKRLFFNAYVKVRQASLDILRRRSGKGDVLAASVVKVHEDLLEKIKLSMGDDFQEGDTDPADTALSFISMAWQYRQNGRDFLVRYYKEENNIRFSMIKGPALEQATPADQAMSAFELFHVWRVQFGRDMEKRKESLELLRMLDKKRALRVVSVYDRLLTLLKAKNDPDMDPEKQAFKLLSYALVLAQPGFDLYVIKAPSAGDYHVRLRVLPEEPVQDKAQNSKDLGGIDMNNIRLDRDGLVERIQFDPSFLSGAVDALDGLVPLIINIMPIDNVFPSTGLNV